MSVSRRNWITPRLLVSGILGGLAAAALVVLAMVLLGEYTKTRGRWLGTALALSGYCLTALGPVALHGRGRYRPVATSGMLFSLLAFALFTVGLWGTPNSDGYWKATSVSTLLALALAHVCWMLFLERPIALVSGIARASALGALLLALLAGVGIIFEVKVVPFWWVVALIAIGQAVTGAAVPITHWWSSLRCGSYSDTSGGNEE